MDAHNCFNLDFPGAEYFSRIVVMFYSKLGLHELKKSENIQIAPAEIAKTNSIKGLYVYENFISEEEE